ncbi:GntP family permease [Lichenicoccus roseus]|uniref:GntP family permease n=1 Tax=Lichenicoccus roseus TaxID=2683649 RepID=A0A5R9J375_9PROT|nr:GntP family permease [Lichenicoccus roseus]TLU70947.1 GntP family permease [Lichenicoccus roseus]
MSLLVALLGLAFLILVAYRGFSVIMFAPVAAMIPVLLTAPSAIPTVFTTLFMAKTVMFVKLYFPIFLLGAVFGKLIELSGFSSSIVAAILRLAGPRRAILSIVLVSAVLCYGGVSLFVVVFAVYPFAAELFRQARIPKRLMPATLALGAFSFTMDALPGTPQIQNIIPTAFLHTTAWAAPWLGTVGGLFILVAGLAYLQWRARRAGDEGYGTDHLNEPAVPDTSRLAPWPVAIAPLVAVGVLNKLFTNAIPRIFGTTDTVHLAGLKEPLVTPVATVTAIWALEAALLAGVLLVVALAFRTICGTFVEGTKAAVAGALLAVMNTGSEFGFGGVIAAMPGFLVARDALSAIPNPLVNAAIATTALAGITGSASGGLSIALSALGDGFIAAARAHHIPLEVLHRVVAMASGGMDCLPHNGAVITVLAVTGLTHRQSYGDIFVITLIKTAAVFLIIGIYYATGLV